MELSGSSQLNSPIAFFVFNRPIQTRIVFEEIRKAKPTTLLLIADGPRTGMSQDDVLCNEVRQIVSSVDWPCVVFKNFSECNLGCKKRVSSGLDWVFSTVESAIILEDDCLPEQSFFLFCDELLDRYRNDERIMQICGSNFLSGWRRSQYSYYYSRYGPIWGWASWRRAWKYYDVNMKLWPEVRERSTLLDICINQEEIRFRADLYEKLYNGEIDTWDYQWGFAKMINSGISIIPNVNLVSNIGFGDDATHTADSQLNQFSEMLTLPIEFPLKHPNFIVIDTLSDKKYMDEFVFLGGKRRSTDNIIKKIKAILGKL